MGRWFSVGEVLAISLDIADYATLVASGEQWAQSLLSHFVHGGRGMWQRNTLLPCAVLLSKKT